MHLGRLIVVLPAQVRQPEEFLCSCVCLLVLFSSINNKWSERLHPEWTLLSFGCVNHKLSGKCDLWLFLIYWTNGHYTSNTVQSADAWPCSCFSAKNLVSVQFWCLTTQLKFPVSVPSRSSRRLSTVKNPFEPVSTEEMFPVWLQLMMAAGFPLSALHTATIVLSLCSNQADVVGATGKTKQEKWDSPE